MSHRVLIVDDDPDFAETIARLLGRAGYTCLSASSGVDAIVFIETTVLALVVTDLHMPGLDGLAVARRAAEKVPPIPVVLMTAYPSIDTERQAREAGVTSYLSKPFANAEMLNAVRLGLTAGMAAGGPAIG